MLLTVDRWALRDGAAAKPWLIVGKGPSFSPERAQSGRAILGLNHVVRQLRCDAALMMDFDAFDACRQALREQSCTLLLPWRPHIKFRPSSTTLGDLLQHDADLAALAAAGRLACFNAATGARFEPLPGLPTTQVRFFSAEAALNLLADHGARDIRTLGIDGGGAYAEAFSDLDEVTRLANGQASFDKQFGEFAKTLRRYPDLQFGPVELPCPARIFIGSDETQLLGAKVFQYSVRRYASISTQFDVIDNAGLPEPRDPERRARTGFSFCRFKIPALAGYAGRAIYVDADMQVFADIRELWSRDFNGAWLLYSEANTETGRIPQFSVMLLDCESLQWDAVGLVRKLDAGAYDYAALMHDFAMTPAEKKVAALEFEWNSLEHYEAGKTKLIHYTDMPKQPWVSDKNPNRELWYAELRRAVADGFITQEEISGAIERGHVSPLLPRWAGLGSHPKAAELLKGWSAPFKRFVRPRLS